ncbi:ABC transporter ATP-binding protein [Thermodesulfobacteriota bacterium]
MIDSNMSHLEVKNISKRFNSISALREVSFSLGEGEILCFLGPSGCGKTTLLRIIAGLETPDEGRVLFNNEDITSVPPHLRKFGMMFQEFALFPHKNVFENVAFGLEGQKRSPQEIYLRTSQVLEMVGLEGFNKRNIDEISGGERQRVALARSLAPQPYLLLLDEPLGALDRALRERLILDLRHILKNIGITTIFVTHDQSEAFAVSDRIAVINQGSIEQIDQPEKLYNRPENIIVAKFLGFSNFLEGTILNDGSVKTGIGILFSDQQRYKENERVMVLLRPEAAKIFNEVSYKENEKTIISGLVKERLFHGKHYHVSTETDNGYVLVFDLPNENPPPFIGERIDLVLQPSGIVIEADEQWKQI